jgi:MFS family permease
LASVGLGFMKVLSTGISLAVVDGIGRRKALLGGIALMAVSILSLAIFAFYQVQNIKGLPESEHGSF